MENISVLIADDSKEFTEKVKKHLQTQNGIQVIDTVEDGVTAYETICLTRPDVVILDLVMPTLDGIGILTKLSRTSLDKKPVIIMVSAFFDDNIIAKAATLGVSYYMAKPVDLESLTQRIKLFVDAAHMENALSGGGNKKANILMQDNGDLETMVSNIIKILGIPAHVKGYQFVRDAIMWAVEDMEVINAVTKELYPGIAKKYSTTSSRVERAIRHAIEISWQRGDVDTINMVFGYTVQMNRGKPTNSEYIAMIADKLRLQLKSSSISFAS